jgi:hypothetical protein
MRSAQSLARSLARSLAAGALGALPAAAQDLYGVNLSTGDLFRISTADASSVLVGSTQVTGLGGLVRAPDGFLYGLGTGSAPILYRIDPANAATVAVGPLGLGFVFEGGLATAPDGTTWGANSGSASTPALYRVSLVTGAATAGPGLTSPPHDLNGIAFRADGALVAIDRETNALLGVDTGTGAVTVIATLAPALGAAGDLTVSGGAAYFATGGSGTSIPGTNELWRVDLFTGAHTRVGSLGAAGTGVGIGGLAGDGSGPPPTPFCFGDGSGAACPCLNASPPGAQAGCLNSLNVGARLTGSGFASVAFDSLVLQGADMPNSTALYFQGTTQFGGGAGVAFGDGLRCAGGTILRLGVELNSGGASHYPAGGDASVSVRGLVAAGDVRTYQIWYRNAGAYCTPSTFNLSNGLSLTWSP